MFYRIKVGGSNSSACCQNWDQIPDKELAESVFCFQCDIRVLVHVHYIKFQASVELNFTGKEINKSSRPLCTI